MLGMILDLFSAGVFWFMCGCPLMRKVFERVSM